MCDSPPDGLMDIPDILYEAAEVDGAKSWQKMVYITLPSIKPIMIVILVIQTMWALKAFDLIWVLTQGGPIHSTTIFSIYAYRQSFQYYRMGYGAAIAYFITFITLILTYVYTRFSREET